jgi:hypothetical protein
MNKAQAAMDPLIEGYFSYLDKVGRKTPRTIVDVRCTLRRAITGLERVRPGVALWHLKLEDYLHWLEAERQCGSTESSLAKWPRRAQRARWIQFAAYGPPLLAVVPILQRKAPRGSRFP